MILTKKRPVGKRRIAFVSKHVHVQTHNTGMDRQSEREPTPFEVQFEFIRV